VSLYYKYKRSEKYKKLDLNLFANNVYGGGINISKIKSPHVIYYIEAEDYAGNKNYLASSKKPEAILLVSKDVISPSINYIRDIKRLDNGKFFIQASIHDNIAVKSVILHCILYGYDGKKNLEVPLNKKINTIYQAVFEINVNNYNSIEYSIRTCDKNENCTSSSSIIEQFNRSGEKIKKDDEPPSFHPFFYSNVAYKPLNYKFGDMLYYPVIFRISDNVGVSEAFAYVRNVGKREYKEVLISKISKFGTYGDLIEGSDIGIELYFKAVDANNLVSFDGSQDNPYSIEINRDTDKMAIMPSTLRKLKNIGEK